MTVGRKATTAYAVYLRFIGPYITNTFSEYNQQDAKFLKFFYSVRRSIYFRRVFRPSSSAQNCKYSVRPLLIPAAGSICQTVTATCCWQYLTDRYCYLLLAVFVRPLLLPAASSICQTVTATCC